MRARGLRLGWIALLMPLLAGCGSGAPQAPTPPPALAVASSLFPTFPKIAASSSRTIALSGSHSRDQLLVTQGVSGATVQVLSGGRTLLRRTGVHALAVAFFGARHLPVLLFEAAGGSVWGYPLSAATYDPSLHAFEPVAFVHPVGGLLVTSELQGFAQLTPQGVTLVSPTGPGAAKAPTGESTTRWVYRVHLGGVGEWLRAH